MNTDEASFAHWSGLLLTPCCAARFLTGHRPVAVGGSGVGDPCTNWFVTMKEAYWYPWKLNLKKQTLKKKKKREQCLMCTSSKKIFLVILKDEFHLNHTKKIR